MSRHLRPRAVLSTFGCAVALALAATAGAAGSNAWVYTGKSTSLDPVTHSPLVMNVVLSASGRTIQRASFSSSYHCAGGDDYTSWAKIVNIPIGKDGSFTKTERLSNGPVTLTGKLLRAGAGVVLSATDVDGCKASGTYQLIRGAGIYGGDTTQGRPISVILAPNGKSAEVSLYWKAECTAGGKSVMHYETARLTNIPVKAGSFAKKGTYTYEYADTGIQFSVVYSIAGKVTAKQASGLFAATAQAGTNGSVERCGKMALGFTAASA